jgi:hypothetical protein
MRGYYEPLSYFMPLFTRVTLLWSSGTVPGSDVGLLL